MRAQVYSIAVVLIIIPLLLFIAFYITSSQTIKFGTTEKTISDQLTHVERSIEDDFARVLGITGRRASLAAVHNIVTNGVFVNNSTQAIIELITNGSIGGNESFLMFNNTLKHWNSTLFNIVTQYNMQTNFSETYVKNYDGFSLNFTSVLVINISDKRGISRIRRNEEKPVVVSIGDIEDPVYTVNTLGKIVRLIDKYPYSYLSMSVVQGSAANGNCSGEVTFDSGVPDSSKILVTQNALGVSGFRGVVAEQTGLPFLSCYVLGAAGAVGKINNTIQFSNYTKIYLDQSTNYTWSLPITDAIDNGYYIRFNGIRGPDFLQRLEGNLNESSAGVESFVNIPALKAQGIAIKEEQTTIDYLYFSNKDNKGEKVRGLPDWFRMNHSIAGIYNLTQLLE